MNNNDMSKSGYHGRPDPMRDMAEALLRSGAKKTSKVQKFAMGGVAKIRHDEATPEGTPKNRKKYR